MICKLVCLKELNLGDCECINKFPKLPKNIVKVDLSGTSIEQVPSSSFDYSFYSLEVLSMKNCTRLESITTSINKLKMLNYLDISYCSNLKCFPHITEPQYLYLHERSEMGSSSFLRFEYQYYRDAYDIAKKSISNPFQERNDNHFDMSNCKRMKSPFDIITIARRDRLGNEELF
ncbi:hypothetical protein G4B88_004556 [Cannabis sativa]|uniref:Uncharacterized protein n=1 Tax=Cannabis sativa TaxID=3483 RepID=A0A7J6G7A0_CANSA|nr:hypothetical protein G4B88_004556 [Cannabis sativa]